MLEHVMLVATALVFTALVWLAIDVPIVLQVALTLTICVPLSALGIVGTVRRSQGPIEHLFQHTGSESDSRAVRMLGGTFIVVGVAAAIWEGILLLRARSQDAAVHALLGICFACWGGILTRRHRRIKFVAQLTAVEEVSLTATADLSFWRERLAAEGLRPAAADGRAQLLLCATNGRFRGVRFSELSVSVAVGEKDDGPVEAYFLVQAFNSVRFFAFVERTVFHTPYDHGRLDVVAGPPAAVRLTVGNDTLVDLRMATEHGLAPSPGRPPRSAGDESWEGPVHLPRKPNGLGEAKLFFARIGGPTQVFDVVADDRLTFQPTARYPALAWLIESDFVGRQWRVRASAAHAKSKTYPRSALASLAPRHG